MCGITGFWAPDSGLRGDGVHPVLRQMADSIRHRGPDAEGFWDDLESGIALAQRRLSILDLSNAGAQPMHSASGRFVIVYNGEIYNHLKIRALLEQNNAAPNWHGHSDTETILAAVDHWGLNESLCRFNGMFALALWDRKHRNLTLARDRMGEKPLYYGWAGKTLLFGSELKALRAFPGFDKSINRQAISSYLRFSYVPCPHTIYRDARKVPPAHLLKFSMPDTACVAEPQPYWSLQEVAETGAEKRVSVTFDEASRELETLFGDVVESQMLSDVPLGSFLSGGIDSSLVTAMMQSRSAQPVKTFSIGFEASRYNEADHARAVAAHLKTDHTEFVVTENDALSLIPQLQQIFDEPFADSSQLPTILLSRLTRENVTVALSGDGGDEVFGGYNRHTIAPKLWRLMGGIPKSGRKAIAGSANLMQRMFTGSNAGNLHTLLAKFGLPVTAVDRLSKFGGAIGRADDINGFYRELISTWPMPGDIVYEPQEAATTLDDVRQFPNVANASERMMILDSLSYLPDDIMVKVDRSTMSASLETRAPFLDRNIVEYAWKLPVEMKIQGHVGKRIVRDILDRHVPNELINRPKQGFAVPMDQWLRGGLKDWAAQLLAPAKLSTFGIFKEEEVQKIWRNHLAGKDNAGARLWTILMLQSWLSEWG